MLTETETASLIMAAGRGSRMKEYEGNKTLLPLVPDRSPFEGTRPILLHILDSLPPGPKAVVVHHRKEAVLAATRRKGVEYCEQKTLDGTGGALLAAQAFIEKVESPDLIITMGDVPLVRKETYEALIGQLKNKSLVVLGFQPASKRQYGVLEIEGGRVKKIIEWKYWRTFPPERQAALRICNSGIYASRKETLLRYLPVLASRPHKIQKEINGGWKEFQEYFITDLIQYMSEDGLGVGCLLAQDETEVMGVDDLTALRKVQELFRARTT